MADRFRLAVMSLIGFRGRDSVPMYWENAHKDIKKAFDRASPDFFDDVFPVSAEEASTLQELLDQTHDNDEVRLRVIRAVRIEHSSLWAEYQTKAAKVAKKRGTCTFAGRGAPCTSQAFEEVPGLDEFTQDLDPGICEAYLWHGTSPQTALKIAKDGFQVNHHSVAGKRFGAGGYFAEDPVRSDKYAGAGEGIYERCYAMLLCRVILGKQYLIREFRAQDATEQARGAHDSTLAEPRGASWREFVAFEAGQVYPEYALVYERRRPDEVVHNELLHDLRVYRSEETVGSGAEQSETTEHDQLVAGLRLPPYWFHAHGQSAYFHDSYPAEAMEPVIQALLDSSWGGRYSEDRKRPDGVQMQLDGEDMSSSSSADTDCEEAEAMPTGVHVLKVIRIEDSGLWSQFVEFQETIRTRRQGQPLRSLAPVQTVEGLPAPERARLAKDVNEVYLWHGCSPSVVTQVALSGFPDKLRNFNQGSYGHGAYFVEDADHADEYSTDDAEGYYRGYYAMLLCRVTLGQPQVLAGPLGLDPRTSGSPVSSPSTAADRSVGPNRPFDSTVGPVPASYGEFREFVVQERSQIYPEYAIIYERKFRRSRTARFSFRELDGQRGR